MKRVERTAPMAAHATATTHVIPVDDASFEEEVLGAKVPVLVDFGAAWCGPCRALAPIVEKIAAEHAGRLKVVTVDTDESPRTAQRYGVRGVPMVMVFRDGEKTGAHLGMTSRERLLELVEGTPAARS
jgi:thioredoxin 1